MQHPQRAAGRGPQVTRQPRDAGGRETRIQPSVGSDAGRDKQNKVYGAGRSPGGTRVQPKDHAAPAHPDLPPRRTRCVARPLGMSGRARHRARPGCHARANAAAALTR